MGPLQNISFEVGMDANTENSFFGAAKRDVVAGLQFAFDLPYKGYVNVSPLMYWEFSNHNSFTQCGSGFSRPFPGVTCTRRRQHLVQADMGGRSQLLHGSRLPAGEHAVLLDQRPRRLVRHEGRTRNRFRRFRVRERCLHRRQDRVQLEPIRLTFDASRRSGVRNIRTSSTSGSPIATGRTSSASITMHPSAACSATSAASTHPTAPAPNPRSTPVSR